VSSTFASKVGFDIGLVHDVHERPAPNQSIELCKAVEQYRPSTWKTRSALKMWAGSRSFGRRRLRRWRWANCYQSQRVAAAGGQSLDRLHPLSSVGHGWPEHVPQGCATVCEFFDVRRRGTVRPTLTRWALLQPASRPGHAELRHPGRDKIDDKVREVFPGAPDIRKGYMYANDKPGFGIDIDEAAAARYPYKEPYEERGNDRCWMGRYVDLERAGRKRTAVADAGQHCSPCSLARILLHRRHRLPGDRVQVRECDSRTRARSRPAFMLSTPGTRVILSIFFTFSLISGSECAIQYIIHHSRHSECRA